MTLILFLAAIMAVCLKPKENRCRHKDMTEICSSKQTTCSVFQDTSMVDPSPISAPMKNANNNQFCASYNHIIFANRPSFLFNFDWMPHNRPRTGHARPQNVTVVSHITRCLRYGHNSTCFADKTIRLLEDVIRLFTKTSAERAVFSLRGQCEVYQVIW